MVMVLLQKENHLLHHHPSSLLPFGRNIREWRNIWNLEHLTTTTTTITIKNSNNTHTHHCPSSCSISPDRLSMQMEEPQEPEELVEPDSGTRNWENRPRNQRK